MKAFARNGQEIKIGHKYMFAGIGPADDAMLGFVYENLCHAEITAFGHTFAR